MTRALLTNGRNRLLTALDTASESFVRRFEIDLRALAAFRIALGTLVIVDLLLRSRHLTAFYTDDGVLPLEALFSDYSSVYSLHAISGEAWVQAVLFVVAGCFAFAMVVGYRTRLATLVSWLLLLSLHTRNPMVLNGGDALFRMLLFWAIFLPLGERWAIDARRTNRDRTTVASVGTMAVLLQVLLMYVTNAIHKTRSDVWMSGDALVEIFQADHLTYLLGNVLAEQFFLLRTFSYVWMTLILLSPLLIVLTDYRRAIITTLFVGMHLGMFVTLKIGLFPLITVAGLVLFYPSVIWDRATALATRTGITTPLRRGLDRLQRSVPRRSIRDRFVTQVAVPSCLPLGNAVASCSRPPSRGSCSSSSCSRTPVRSITPRFPTPAKTFSIRPMPTRAGGCSRRTRRPTHAGSWCRANSRTKRERMSSTVGSQLGQTAVGRGLIRDHAVAKVRLEHAVRRQREPPLVLRQLPV